MIALASLLFGAMTVCVRAVAQDMPPMQVAFWRFVGSLAFLLMGVGRSGVWPQRAPIRVLLLRGLLGASAISLWFTGIRDVGAAIATLLHSTYPVWATLVGVVVLGERFGGRMAVALAVNLCGIAIVVGPEVGRSEHMLRGMACSLGAGMLAGAAVATARQLRTMENASVITVWFMATGALLTAPSLLLPAPPWSGGLVVGLVLVALTSTGGQWLLHHGLGFTTAAQGSLAAATSIVTTALLERWWFGSTLGGHTLVGGALMIAAVGLALTATPSAPAVALDTDAD